MATTSTETITVSSGISKRIFTATRCGNVIVYKFMFDVTSAKSNGDTIFTGIPSDFRPSLTYYGLIQAGSGTPNRIGIFADGHVEASSGGLPVGTYYTGTLVGAVSN